MLKAEPALMPESLYEVWRLGGRDKTHLDDWGHGLLTSIKKQGDPGRPQNYRPVCMLSCARKIIESAIVERVSRKLKVFGRQFGFQRRLSATVTLLDVDAVVRSGRNKVATLDLVKAYDKVNRSLLLCDCERALNKGVTKMLKACLQVMTVKPRGMS